MKTRLLSFLVALLALGGCSLVVDGEVGGLEPNLNAKRDVRLVLNNFEPHLGQLVDLQIIRPESNDVQARVVFDPLPSACVDVLLPRGAPLDATVVEFFADLNDDRVLSAPGDDHVWRSTLRPSESEPGVDELRFVHNTQFEDLRETPPTETGAALELSLTGLDASEGATVVVAVIRQELVTEGEPLQETIPAVAVGQVQGGMVNLTVGGIIDQNAEHTIEVNVGSGATACALTETAPNARVWDFSHDVSDFDCTATAHRLFTDCAR